MADFAALIGIDWSDRKHDLCLVETASGKREASVLPHSPQEIDEWAAALRSRFGGRPVAVCLEQSRGPLLYALLKYDFLTLYPVNPRSLARFREAFSPSRHKGRPARRRTPGRTAPASPRAAARLATGRRADPNLALACRTSEASGLRPHPPQQPPDFSA